ncbi:dimethyladenosine transferase 2, mitochondrial [Erinaceus europaeus]|uniref:rRNA adenine N(6)-methyltransferase n=1 Tax=Erinaceus europaeus TaxID=9365 RepID=A0ABM3XGZ3_ERIEU|nr:dimethyladenosine transferase 2, mitochondrial [Erinaceus europaeus]
MWVAVGALSPRLTLSAWTGASRFCLLRCGKTKRKDLPLRNCLGVSDFRQSLWSGVGFEDQIGKNRFDPRRYITCPELAKNMARVIEKHIKPSPVVLECSPGPGILTQELVGLSSKVIALESDNTFIPQLKSLQKKLDGQLQVVYCDFFKLDPASGGTVRPPIMYTDTLFENLGIRPTSWTADVPMKVIGLLPVKNEKKVLWKLLHDIYSCTSIFQYGRVELNLFIGEQEYQILVANPKSPRMYQSSSVLWQIACDIKLLHTESCSSFDISKPNGKLKKPKEPHQPLQRLCFVQLTPRKNLFTENLTPINYDIFFHMIKQCFVRRSDKLTDHLPSLSPVDVVDILKHIHTLNQSKITDIYPEEFKRLFEIIDSSKEYTHRWLYDEYMEEVIL